MARTLVILNDPPYGTERSHSALRRAGATLARRDGEQVRLFLMGDAAGCGKSHQKVAAGHHNVEVMVRQVGRHGEVGVCGSCMDARGIAHIDLAERARRSSLEELADWVHWADRALVCRRRSRRRA